ncbi:FAD-dependent oxidoreductase [Halobacillus sp. Marseille-Q1614]|uniref:FAD-dependent oxidoreductase n=1 Tax=Halobacillus sp. Marseille-Q1614 TaxID=2709134 RepID=UPI00156DA178|nr:FAD-dependent oxidoreductase [Halobacillus sp. Marseille-Q1614]
MDEKLDWTHPEPLWRKNANIPSFEPLQEAEDTEVVVVGGGITGISTAYLLAKEGKKVILIEADHVINGTSGHTTAKVTAQHDMIYNELIQHFGEEQAALYYKAQDDALSSIEKTIQELDISCQWKREDAYLYAVTAEGARKLEKERKAYERLGIKGGMVEKLPFPEKATAVLAMKHQAQFHPVQYLMALLEEFQNLGGTVYEKTKAVKVHDRDRVEIETGQNATLTCDSLVICSHFPFHDGRGFYFSRMYADRSYAIAVEPETEWKGGMYLAVDGPSRSVRSTEYNGKQMLIIGGEKHRTGEGGEHLSHFEALEDFASRMFGIKSQPFKWSAQDLTTLDKVPYIGPIQKGNKRIYVATGYRKWGMTNSRVASELITDYIMGRESLYHSLFTPSRFNADPSMKEFMKNNFTVASHLVEGKLELVGTRPEALLKGEGAIVQWKGERAGAYKDQNGELHVLDTTCTHMGCEVEWNSAEHSWDCPCHGSRFSYDGHVMEGPAKQPLKKIAYSDTDELRHLPPEDYNEQESTDQP